MMATLKDVAALSGVSTATASLALNHGPVNEVTRQRVLQCAKKLGYVPNRIGRMLTTGQSNLVELLIMNSGGYTDTVRQTALFYYLIEGVLSVMDERNYAMRFNVRSHDDPDLSRYLEQVVGDNLLDGIIVVPQYLAGQACIERLQQAGFPHVVLAPRRFARGAHHVDMGNRDGGRLVGALFGRTGRTRPALINGPPTHIDAIEREQGFSAGLHTAGLALAGRSFGDFTVGSGYAAMAELLGDLRPDAVFCANDYMAAGALKLLHDRGLHVPRDIAVVGYDNSDVSGAVTPSLTSVDNHFVECGRRLADELLRRIHNTEQSALRKLQPVLVERDTH